MTTPSLHESIGISLGVYKPSVTADGTNVIYIPRGSFVENFTEYNGYGHTTRAMGGYWAAQFTIAGDLDKLEEWYANRLGYHIESYNSAMGIVWEGFINKVSLNVGGLAATRGPLMDVANRVSVVYSPLDVTVLPPTTGASATTVIVDDADSKLKYGVLEEILSAGRVIDLGGAWDDTPEKIRDTYLQENKEPEASKTFSTQRSNDPSVTIELLGYVHFLDKAKYNYTDNSLSVTVSDAVVSAEPKLQAILGQYAPASDHADPNSLFDTDNGDVYANRYLVPRYEDENMTAWALIKEMVALGDDGTDARTIFGIYADRYIKYDVIPSALEYQQNLSDSKQAVRTIAGVEIRPWDVLPGKWMLFTDFLIGETIPSELRLDPRAMFIESVDYTAPWGLMLNGNKVATLQQKLAKTALEGIGS